MAATFKDARGRDWSVYITGLTISEAAARGIDLSADFVRGIIAALRATIGAGAQHDDPEAAEDQRDAENTALVELGATVISLRLIGTLVELCWLGCRHHARVQADKVSEREFKEGLHGKSLKAAAFATFNALAECFDMPLQLGEQSDPTEPAASGAASGKQ